MLSKILNYIFCAMLLCSSCACSDSDFLHRDTDAEMRVNLIVPSIETVNLATRVNDRHISSLTVLTFNGTGGNSVMVQAPADVTDWNETSVEDAVKIDFRMTLDSEIADRSNLSFLIFANLPSGISQSLQKGVTLRSDVDNINIDVDDAVDDGILMCGATTYSQLFSPGASTHTVELKRIIAGIEVTSADGNTPLEFIPYGAPDNVALLSPLNSTPPAPGATPLQSSCFADGTRQYIAPVANNSADDPFSLDAQPFVVVKADYNGSSYFYRLAFADKDTDNNYVALDILPNHLYKFKIGEVKVPGYDTPEAASAGIPSSPLEVDYTIVDMQPTIFNMTSDGRRELGITDKIEDPLGDACIKEFYVKCFPAVSDFSQLSFSCDADWVTLSSSPVEIMEVEDASGQTATLFKFEAKLERNPFSEHREGIISVTWRGLTTNMGVSQDLNFNSDNHTSIALEIHESDGSLYRRISDYWSFLKGEGTEIDPGTKGATLTAPILYGTSEKVNGGLIRTHGLHFPVLNGGRTYSYTITPDFTSESGAASYRAFLKRSFGFTAALQLDNATKNLGESFSVTMAGDNEIVGIAESTLVIMAYDEEGNAVDMLSIDLYHTGFFDWSDYPDYRCNRTNDPKIEQAWYYYETIPFTEGDEIVYWLDRNVGARSRGFDIADASGMSIFTQDPSYPFLSGDGSAMGGLYHEIATPSYTYDDPEMKTDFGPPGYRIPTEALFNDLRHSPGFITDRRYSPSGISYYAAYLELSDGTRIYFPKNSHLQNHLITSEGRTGNYWTSTAAHGFEKDEIGKWLSIFVLSGNSSSISRARLVDPESALSARLVNEAANHTEYYQTFLKVKGATHVFLYAENGDAREWPFPWPGQAVSNPDIAFNDYANFVYESNRNVEYMVIFNFVDDKGAITTMAKADSDKALKAIGWPASGSFSFTTDHLPASQE